MKRNVRAWKGCGRKRSEKVDVNEFLRFLLLSFVFTLHKSYIKSSFKGFRDLSRIAKLMLKFNEVFWKRTRSPQLSDIARSPKNTKIWARNKNGLFSTFADWSTAWRLSTLQFHQIHLILSGQTLTNSFTSRVSFLFLIRDLFCIKYLFAFSWILDRQVHLSLRKIHPRVTKVLFRLDFLWIVGGTGAST